MSKGSNDTKRAATNGASKAASQDLKKEIKRLNSDARKLLKNAGKDIRQVRSEVARLKKLGIVSERINARSYIPSRYMLTKLRKNADVLSGEMVALKAKPSVIKKYVEKGVYEKRGKALIIPRESVNQRTRISRGMVEIVRPLAYGEEIQIIMPFKATDMQDIAEKLKVDPSLDGLKNPDELFGFRLFGHNMATIGFPDASELGDYILTHYAHLFSGRNGKAGMKNFILFRFKARDSQLKEALETGKIWDKRKPSRKRDNRWLAEMNRDKAAKRKAKQRAKETPEQRAKRLGDQKERSRYNRETKAFEKPRKN